MLAELSQEDRHRSAHDVVSDVVLGVRSTERRASLGMTDQGPSRLRLTAPDEVRRVSECVCRVSEYMCRVSEYVCQVAEYACLVSGYVCHVSEYVCQVAETLSRSAGRQRTSDRRTSSVCRSAAETRYAFLSRTPFGTCAGQGRCPSRGQWRKSLRPRRRRKRSFVWQRAELST